MKIEAQAETVTAVERERERERERATLYLTWNLFTQISGGLICTFETKSGEPFYAEKKLKSKKMKIKDST